VYNIIFVVKNATEIPLLSKSSLIPTNPTEKEIPEGFRLVGLRSQNTLDGTGVGAVQVIRKLEMYFINSTSTDLRCQAPSQELIYNITALFLNRDTDRNGFIQSSEVNKIFANLTIPEEK